MRFKNPMSKYIFLSFFAFSGAVLSSVHNPGDTVSLATIDSNTAVIKFSGSILLSSCDLYISGTQAIAGLKADGTTGTGNVIPIYLGEFLPSAAAAWTNGMSETRFADLNFVNCPAGAFQWKLVGPTSSSLGANVSPTNGANGKANKLGVSVFYVNTTGSTTSNIQLINADVAVSSIQNVTIDSDNGSFTAQIGYNYVLQKAGDTSIVASAENVMLGLDINYFPD